jgi:ribose transport system substrate-binding protein
MTLADFVFSTRNHSVLLEDKMKISKKIVLITVLVLSMTLAACQAPTPPLTTETPAAPADSEAPSAPTEAVAPAGSGDTATFVVGYSAAGLIDDLQISWSESVQKTIEDAGGEVIIVDSQNKIAKQVADIEDLLTQNIDYLVVNPVDEAGIVPAIEAANAANVPVITIDRAAGGGDVAVHVGFDNYKAGFDAGEYCAQQMGGKGEVAQLEGQAGTSVARERGQGFNDAIAQYPDMSVVFDKPTDWDTAKALAATEDMLSANPDVKCIWAHADSIIMGAVQALENAGKLDQVITIGMGMFGGGPEAIKAGKLTASWELYSDQLGQIAGQAVVDLHDGKQVEKLISTDMTFVTSDNIDQFLK